MTEGNHNTKHGAVSIGDTFNRLEVIEYIGIKKYKYSNARLWKCKCSCGNIVEVTTHALRSGSTKSCGCLHKEFNASGNARRTHGMCDSPEHNAWLGMKKRCFYAAHDKYKYYGGRGITIYEPWVKDFSAFYEEIGPMPEPGMSVDRIDGDKNYEPGNVRWATQIEQARNKSSTIKLTFNGEERPLPEWAEIMGIAGNTIRNRLRDGWDIESALTTPLKKDRTYTYKGVSGTVKQLAEAFNVSCALLHGRLRNGFSIERAIETPNLVPVYEFNGKEQSIGAWAKEYGMPRNLVYQRIKELGWPLEKALTTPKNSR